MVGQAEGMERAECEGVRRYPASGSEVEEPWMRVQEYNLEPHLQYAGPQQQQRSLPGVKVVGFRCGTPQGR